MTYIQEKVEEFNTTFNPIACPDKPYTELRTNAVIPQEVKNWLTTTLTEALEEGKRMELELLYTHLERQIFEPTVYTASIYKYIEARMNALTPSPQDNPPTP